MGILSWACKSLLAMLLTAGLLRSAVSATVVQESAKLTASDGAAIDTFGKSVAISGTTAIVGAPGKAYKGQAQQGVAYIYSYNGTSWVQVQELSASDGAAHDAFGTSVAIAGNTAFIGAPNNIVGTVQQGAVYVYAFNGSSWMQQQKLTAFNGASNDAFGQTVAFANATAVVGAPMKAIGSNSQQGAAYLFALNGSTWSSLQELTAVDGVAGDQFGSAVAMSNNEALVGASAKSNSSGEAYVYVPYMGSWVLQAQLMAGDPATGDAFATSVAIDGTTALIGAPNKTIGSNLQQGAFYAFSFNGCCWTQYQKLTLPTGLAYDQFGSSIALASNTAIVGATLGSTNFRGSAYVLSLYGSSWAQALQLHASDSAPNDRLGNSVSISGTTAIVGAYFKTVGANNFQGVAYAFSPVVDTIFSNGFEGP